MLQQILANQDALLISSILIHILALTVVQITMIVIINASITAVYAIQCGMKQSYASRIAHYTMHMFMEELVMKHASIIMRTMTEQRYAPPYQSAKSMSQTLTI